VNAISVACGLRFLFFIEHVYRPTDVEHTLITGNANLYRCSRTCIVNLTAKPDGHVHELNIQKET